MLLVKHAEEPTKSTKSCSVCKLPAEPRTGNTRPSRHGHLLPQPCASRLQRQNRLPHMVVFCTMHSSKQYKFKNTNFKIKHFRSKIL